MNIYSFVLIDVKGLFGREHRIIGVYSTRNRAYLKAGQMAGETLRPFRFADTFFMDNAAGVTVLTIERVENNA
jgi:hypothetical protein